MMPCPKCRGETKVIDSRWWHGSKQVARRRHCKKCKHRWTTFEWQTEPVQRNLKPLIDDMEGLMAEAIKEFRKAVE
jgi:transcriptional regulator NrdR family protein